MATKLSVAEEAAARMQSGDGLILALLDAGSSSVTVVGAVPAPADAAAQALLSDMLPGGVYIAGSYSSSSSSSSQQPTAQGSPAQGKPSVSANQSSSGLHFSLNGTVLEQPRMVSTNSDGSTVVPGFTTFRCHADVSLQVIESGASASGRTAAVNAAFEELEQALLGPDLVFITDVRSNSSRTIISRTSEGSISSALGAATAIVSCSPLLRSCQQGSSASQNPGLPAAPVYDYRPVAPSQLISVPLGLDVLCYVANSAELHSAAVALEAALRAQLAVVKRMLLAQATAASATGKASAAGTAGTGTAETAGAAAGAAALVPLRARHFAPPGLGHHVTLLYPNLGPNPEAAEPQLLPVRQAAHAALGLPTNVPMLRFANALDCDSGVDSNAASTSGRSARLRNVHSTLQAPGIGGKTYLVDGLYDYYHYMQDRFNDNGWGCAYRSLQTICSWFALQRYTGKPVPGHRDIQQLLVRIGDKEPSFIGSSQWIGAIELSYILDEYLGVTCKIITVNKGSDMPSHARELAAHFINQGTPVMIGGGVLAYTLLGVQFNEQTGEAAFLILDPHYTGGEDLGKIVQGTWVGWKRLGDSAAAGGPLFVANAFYNLLCPIRPSTV